MERTQKILIVDDERFNINVLNNLLKNDYKIMAAVNGKQALKAVRSDNPPNLILLDIMMPEMDGYEVCRQLKADPATKNIPVIFVTAMGQTEEETKGLELGAVDYITKPIEYDELALVISRALEKKELIVQRKDAEERAQKSKQEVEEINKELQARIRDLERFNKVTMGRELKIIELKERIKELDETGGELKTKRIEY